MVSFGSKAGTNYKIDSSASKSTWFVTLKAGQELRVRFLQEPWDWWKFTEHYHPTLRNFPCTGDGECYGCNHESDQVKRKSTRYGVNALDTAKGEVVPLKMPFELTQRLFARADRSGGTLMDRDYTIWREGAGMDTKYDYEAMDRQEMSLTRYKANFFDCEAMVAQSFEDAFGKAEPDQYKKEVPAVTTVTTMNTARAPGGGDPWVAPVKEEENLPFDQGAEAPKASIPVPLTHGDGIGTDEYEVITEEQLKAMDLGELVQIAKDNIESPEPWDTYDQELLMTRLLQELG